MEKLKISYAMQDPVDYSIEQLKALFMDCSFPGFIGDICENCEANVNAINGSLWCCLGCGRYNEAPFIDEEVNKLKIYSNPDYGPDFEKIKLAIIDHSKLEKYSIIK